MAHDNGTQLADALARLLANTYLLCLKTQNYHWNVSGPYFPSFHTLFEENYTLLFRAVDETAERIRMLGFLAPGSYFAFSKLATLKEETETPPALEMVRNLSDDHRLMIKELYDFIDLSQKERDEGTTDFLVGRLKEHEKILWMLESTLE